MRLLPGGSNRKITRGGKRSTVGAEGGTMHIVRSCQRRKEGGPTRQSDSLGRREGMHSVIQKKAQRNRVLRARARRNFLHDTGIENLERGVVRRQNEAWTLRRVKTSHQATGLLKIQRTCNGRGRGPRKPQRKNPRHDIVTNDRREWSRRN